MKNKSSKKAAVTAHNMVNYTRSKNAYDGNMEITNLKASSQKETVKGTGNNGNER